VLKVIHMLELSKLISVLSFFFLEENCIVAMATQKKGRKACAVAAVANQTQSECRRHLSQPLVVYAGRGMVSTLRGLIS